MLFSATGPCPFYTMINRDNHWPMEQLHVYIQQNRISFLYDGEFVIPVLIKCLTGIKLLVFQCNQRASQTSTFDWPSTPIPPPGKILKKKIQRKKLNHRRLLSNAFHSFEWSHFLVSFTNSNIKTILYTIVYSTMGI